MRKQAQVLALLVPCQFASLANLFLWLSPQTLVKMYMSGEGWARAKKPKDLVDKYHFNYGVLKL